VVGSIARTRTSSEDLISWVNRFLNEENIDKLFVDAILQSLSFILPGCLTDKCKDSNLDLLSLPVMCYQALGGEAYDANELDIAWSLLYAAAHLLDNIEDEDGFPPLFEKHRFGEIINITTGMIFCSELILSKLILKQKVNPATINILLANFNRLALRTCMGQHLDLALDNPDLVTVWKSVSAKSGDFFALACVCGAALKTSDQKILAAFEIYGHHLGVLIQIANDIEGLWEHDGNLGDLSKSKVTLPVAYAYHVLPLEKRSALICLVNAPGREAITEARQMILECGALIYLFLEAEKHRCLAQKAIINLPLQPTYLERFDNIINKVCQITNSIPSDNRVA
jgi:geranylgeranyl diphosphate synthase, type I